MPTLSGMQLAPPKDWQEFQRICRDLWSRIWKDPDAQENGRQGQPQAGVDVFGVTQGKQMGVQCKQKDGLASAKITVKELIDEVEKAKSFKPVLSSFSIATTGPRDQKIQLEARELTAKHEKIGSFTVHIWSWEDIESELAKHPDLIENHWPQLSGHTIATQTTEEIISSIKSESEDIKAFVKEELKTQLEGFQQTKQLISTIPGTELEDDLSFIKNLIEKSKPLDALNLIERLISNQWNHIADKTKFRLITNKGVCLLTLGKQVEAAALFVEARQYNTDDEKAIVNAAFGYYMRRDSASASHCIDEALKKNPLSTEAWTLRIQFSSTTLTLESLVADVPEVLRDEEKIIWARAIALQRMGLLPESEKYFDLALTQSKERSIELLVQTASIKLDNAIREELNTPSHGRTEDNLKKVKSAISLFTEALSGLSESGIIPVRIQAHINRAIGYRTLGDLGKAKDDLELAIRWENMNFEVVKLRVSIAREENDPTLAILLLEPFQKDEHNIIAKLLMADSLAHAKRYEDSIAILSSWENWLTHSDHKINALVIMAECYIRLNNFPTALSLADEMDRVNPKSFIPLLYKGRVARLQGDPIKAKTLLISAKSIVAHNVDFLKELQLADELFALELYVEASEIYARLTSTDSDNNITRKLIISYYESDEWELARNACRSLLDKDPKVDYATEILSEIYESIGDLDSAILTLNNFLIHSVHDHIRLRLASVLLRKGEQDESKNEIQRISAPLDFPSKDIAIYASVARKVGLIEESIRILYEARRKYSYDPDISIAHLIPLLYVDEGHQLFNSPKSVEIDSVVFLQSSSGKKEYYIIEDRTDPDYLKREIKITDPTALKLLGKRRGERIDLEENPFQSVLWEITEIKSKYLHAFHETLETHARRFPGQQDLFSFHAPTDDQGVIDTDGLHQQMLSVIPHRNRYDPIMEQYKNGMFTIGTVARILNLDVFSVTGSLTLDRTIGVYASSGTSEEYDQAKQIIESTKSIVIDPTSLFIVYILDIKELIKARYNTLIIAQSSLDEFNIMIQQKSIGGQQPAISIYREGEYLVKQEHSIEERVKYLESIRILVAWLKANCAIVPINRALTMSREIREQKYSIYSQSVYDSILIALENNIPILSDDGKLAGFVDNGKKIERIWTDSLLKHEYENGIISEDQYYECVFKLLALGVHHIPVNSESLLIAAKKTKWSIEYPLSTLLGYLSGLRCEENSAINVATDFLYKLWLEPVSPITRDSIVIALLEALISQRQGRSVIQKVHLHISMKFKLWPIAERALHGLVDSWARMRLY